MLLVTRKSKQGVWVRFGNQKVFIRVHRIHNNKVSLAFEAPREVTIWREEIQEEVAGAQQ